MTDQPENTPNTEQDVPNTEQDVPSTDQTVAATEGQAPEKSKSKTDNRARRRDYYKISRALEGHHVLFDKFWQLGKAIFSKQIPTAGVIFSRQSGDPMHLMFNPDFYDSLDFEAKVITVAHEGMHVALNHGVRLHDARSKTAANIAADLVINHLLVNRFGFLREDFPCTNEDGTSGICWVDTVFGEDSGISDSETYEFYYTLLMNKTEETLQKIADMYGFPDDHGSMMENGDGGSGEDDGQGGKSVIEELNDSMTTFEKETLKEIIERHYQEERKDKAEKEGGDPGGKEAGSNAGNIWTFADTVGPTVKRQWEQVIKLWSKKFLQKVFKPKEQWARTCRRMFFMGGNLMIPTEMEIETTEEEEDRIVVWFFQDTSGSYAHLKDRLFAAAESLPKRKFDVRMHCFDTQVYETSLETKELKGFGGTSFSCIEEYIQQAMQSEDENYPEAVFVLTDGYGDSVSPQDSNKWFWFLTEDGSESYIPEESHKFLLKDFE
jgi:hypothetical protein